MEELTRPKFISELLAEVDSFDPTLFAPYGEIEKDETFVGVIENIWLRKVFAAMKFYSRELDQLKLQHKYENCESPDAQSLHRGIEVVHYKRELLNEILWACVRDELNTFGRDSEYDSLGIRKDWKVVQSVSQKSQFKKLLGGLLGGGSGGFMIGGGEIE